MKSMEKEQVEWQVMVAEVVVEGEMMVKDEAVDGVNFCPSVMRRPSLPAATAAALLADVAFVAVMFVVECGPLRLQQLMRRKESARLRQFSILLQTKEGHEKFGSICSVMKKNCDRMAMSELRTIVIKVRENPS
jgi:hypothetical protein